MPDLVRYDTIVDAETGEIRYEKSESYKNKLWDDRTEGGMILPRNHHKKYYNNIRLSDRIESKDDLLKTYMLSEYIVKDTNKIGRKTGKGFATESDIAVIIGATEKRAREYLSRMQKMRILAKITTETGDNVLVSYAFNPAYVNSCKYVPLELYAAFQADLDRIIPAWMQARYAEAWTNKYRVEEGNSEE